MSLQHEGFSRALRALVAASPVSLKRTLLAEAGSILKACAGRTKVAKPEAISRGVRLRIVRELGFNGGRSSADIYINAGIRGDYGRVWRRTRGRDGFQQTHAAGFKPLNRHFGDKAWIDLKEAVEDFRYEERKHMPLAKGSAGLARQSWVQIADSLGISLEDVPGGGLSAAGLRKARAALNSKGQAVVNGFSQAEGQAHGFFVRLVNSLPYGPKVGPRGAGLDQVLESVLAGRAGYFERNLAKGVFDDQAKLLRAYPGLTIHHSA